MPIAARAAGTAVAAGGSAAACGCAWAAGTAALCAFGTALDLLTSSYSHELAETVSDPRPYQGWSIAPPEESNRSKYPFAFSDRSRKKPNVSPLKAFVPLLVTMLK